MVALMCRTIHIALVGCNRSGEPFRINIVFTSNVLPCKSSDRCNTSQSKTSLFFRQSEKPRRHRRAASFDTAMFEVFRRRREGVPSTS